MDNNKESAVYLFERINAIGISGTGQPVIQRIWKSDEIRKVIKSEEKLKRKR